MRVRFFAPLSLLALAGCPQHVRSNVGGDAPSSTSASTASSIAPPLPKLEGAARFAVVELFTSEGCSSCPPADALLGALVEEARAAHRPLYALSFHVDYWNDLGWRDPYSDASFSARQRDYAHAFHESGVYTPQAIVDGARGLVGSNEGELRASIERALIEERAAELTLSVTAGDDPSTANVTFTLTPVVDDAVVAVALVERDVVDDVRSGENAGRTLHHQNVVRAFETIHAAKQGVVAIAVPASVRRDRASVIAFVQREDRSVVAASEGELTP